MAVMEVVDFPEWKHTTMRIVARLMRLECKYVILVSDIREEDSNERSV